MRRIPESELIINQDGSIFHLHLKPEDLAEKVILVGDPGRVEMIAALFDKVEFRSSNREFVSATGWYQSKHITVLSTGIGTDNIDIVLNELDALVNIDFNTRTIKPNLTSLEIVRIGTSGGLQEDLPVDSWLLSEKSIGFDGLLNFYDGRNRVCDLAFESAFLNQISWNQLLTKPYVVDSSKLLLQRFDSKKITKGITISAPGFYGPQGRELRLPIENKAMNDQIQAFRYNGYKITNFEMESSAIAGLSALLGHEAITMCAIIANRVSKTYSKDYKPVIRELVEYVLENI